MIKKMKRNKSKYEINPNDSLFQRLSKAYKRVGYARLFEKGE